jgi:hypothetical protein
MFQWPFKLTFLQERHYRQIHLLVARGMIEARADDPLLFGVHTDE